MKAPAARKTIRRQIFVFTTQEKKAAAFVLAAFLLGVTVKHYRDAHPRTSPPPLSERQKYQQQRADKRAKAYARSARGQEEAARRKAAAQTPAPPLPAGHEQD